VVYGVITITQSYNDDLVEEEERRGVESGQAYYRGVRQTDKDTDRPTGRMERQTKQSQKKNDT
jgi:hypothetical protein